MVLFSVLILFLIIFSILVVPGVVGLCILLYGIYLLIKGNKNDSIKKLRSGLILMILGILIFVTFRFDVNIKIEDSNNKVIEEYDVKI